MYGKIRPLLMLSGHFHLLENEKNFTPISFPLFVCYVVPSFNFWVTFLSLGDADMVGYYDCDMQRRRKREREGYGGGSCVFPPEAAIDPRLPVSFSVCVCVSV